MTGKGEGERERGTYGETERNAGEDTARELLADLSHHPHQNTSLTPIIHTAEQNETHLVRNAPLLQPFIQLLMRTGLTTLEAVGTLQLNNIRPRHHIRRGRSNLNTAQRLASADSSRPDEGEEGAGEERPHRRRSNQGEKEGRKEVEDWEKMSERDMDVIYVMLYGSVPWWALWMKRGRGREQEEHAVTKVRDEPPT